jgi:phosphoribosylanthranilate isomerase
MKYSTNISEALGLDPYYMGFIFYEKSKRYVGNQLDEKLLKSFSKINKVGVFVNQEEEFILDQAKKYDFKFIQLHGNESPALCKNLKAKGYKVIKAFSLDENFDFSTTEPYKPVCDFFLFDTKGEDYGGTGKKFNWEILKKYDNEIPFFLSGGIDLEQAGQIKTLKGLNLHAIDINSRFETEPGLKDLGKIKKFIEQL